MKSHHPKNKKKKVATRAQKRGENGGNASHQLKNHITTISLNFELLVMRLKGENDTENLRMVRDIQEQIAHLVNLIAASEE